MKKTFLLLLSLATFAAANAQQPETKKKKVIDLSDRPADHFLIQYGSDTWLNAPDSVNTKGFSRHFNVYIMLDKPFKSNPKFSVGYGLGIGSSNIFFDKTYVDVKANSSKLPFRDVSNTNHFKKFKLTTIRLELPVELRYFGKPETPGRSWKGAVGVKVGTLLKAYTKGKNLVDKDGNTVYGTGYIAKESNKKFFNGTSLALTGRIGYGAFSLHVNYQLTNVIKQGFGPDVKPLSIGLTVSGL